MDGRVIAIGDIHGCLAAFDALLERICPSASDTIVTLGDYVDRGPDSGGVLTRLAELKRQCKLVPLLGNHDDILLRNRRTRTRTPEMPSADPFNGMELFDEEHFDFLETCPTYYEIDSHFFVHANYDPKLPLEEQDRSVLLWLKLDSKMPRRHRSKKIAIVGHTSQRSGEILSRPHLKCIDTSCYGGGWLTAMDVHTDEVWQADLDGRIRDQQ